MIATPARAVDEEDLDAALQVLNGPPIPGSEDDEEVWIPDDAIVE